MERRLNEEVDAGVLVVLKMCPMKLVGVERISGRRCMYMYV